MKISPVLLGLSLAVAGSLPAAAQDASTSSIPTVLQITREFIKPYKNGMAHDKTESAFITAMSKAKFPAYYVGLNSMSGRSRSLFMTRYSSFAEWEKDNKLIDKSPSLGGELERAGIADGDLLDQLDSEVFTYDADMSYHPHTDLENHRVYEMYVFHIKQGHTQQWKEIVKMVKEAHDKAGTSAHWGMYEAAYGVDDGTYVAISGHKSMTDVDTGFAEGKKWIEAMGPDGMKRLDELSAEAIESSHAELFTVNPKQSYVSEEWIKSDVDFWRPKPAKAAAESAIAKPAAKPASPASKPASR